MVDACRVSGVRVRIEFSASIQSYASPKQTMVRCTAGRRNRLVSSLADLRLLRNPIADLRSRRLTCLFHRSWSTSWIFGRPMGLVANGSGLRRLARLVWRVPPRTGWPGLRSLRPLCRVESRSGYQTGPTINASPRIPARGFPTTFMAAMIEEQRKSNRRPSKVMRNGC